MADVDGSANNSTNIQRFFHSKNLLITGSSGFVGKVLLEKLLRSCPNVGTIYVLLRPKHNTELRRRVEDIFKTQIFDAVKRDNPDALKKVVAIRGDVTLPRLGLSDEDEATLIDNVSVVFHSAANVRFDEPLRTAVNLNVGGTYRLLELCRKMKMLQSVVHVSTAYCNCLRSSVDEGVYPTRIHPKQLMDALTWMDDDTVAVLTPHLLAGYPNTYVFTKALAEQLVLDSLDELPIVIIRPSIIVASWKEPMPGWIDSFSGATGVMVAGGKGVLRTMLGDVKKIVDIIPVDVVVNMSIVAAWYTATFRESKINILHCTSGCVNPTMWGKLLDDGKKFISLYPQNKTVWYPGGTVRSNRIHNSFMDFLMHYLPAAAVDAIRVLAGRKARYVKIYHKMQTHIDTLEYFSIREWQFRSDNQWIIRDQMDDVDKQNFDFDIRSLNWSAFMENYIVGIKRYLLKEDLSSLPSARKHLRKLYIVHNVASSLGICALFRLALIDTGLYRILWDFVDSMSAVSPSNNSTLVS